MDLDKRNFVDVDGSRWWRISAPHGWKNEDTGVTAGDPWMRSLVESSVLKGRG